MGSEHHTIGSSLDERPSAASPRGRWRRCEWLAPYASLVSALGVGFVFISKLFAAVFLGALVLGSGSVAHSTRKHRSPWPLVLTLVGALMALIGRFVEENNAIQRMALPLLMGGVLLNFWLLKRPRLTEVHS